jgi:hypothetical protein
MSTIVQVERSDLVAARVTGLGVGLVTFMVTWTLGARISERVVDAPTSAYAAMATALVAGLVAAVLTGRRLVARLRLEAIALVGKIT